MKRKLVFVTSHPIQYQVPVFRELHSRSDIDLTVLFAQIPDAQTQGAGFGVQFKWDIPLLDGYNYSRLQNTAKKPSVTQFGGCDTPDVYDELKRLRPDLVVINGWVVKTCVQALLACKRLRIPVAVRGEANNIRKRPFWKRLLQRSLVKRFDFALPIGMANRKFYLDHGFSSQRLFASPYCVENERFQRLYLESKSNRNTLRQNWGIPLDSTCFLYCGKFEEKKHPIELLRVVSKVREKKSNFHLLMVGDGELRKACEHLADELKIPVTFAGFLNQSAIVNSYVAADVLMLPSDSGETWGLVVNEAMNCGVPAIVSDQVGCREDLIIEGKTGWSFPFGDWSHLEKCIELSLKKDSSNSAMHGFCQAHIQNYSPAKAADGMEMALVTSMKNRRK